MGLIDRKKARDKRKKRIQKKIRGTSERPRLTVFRSSKHIYAQLINDQDAVTIASVSSISKNAPSELKGKGGNKEGASMVGKSIAAMANEKGIKKVVFDRNGFLYHGRIKSLADAARKNGLEF